MSHGLGMQLTEYPSFQEGGDVVLETVMVMTLEFVPGRYMVHEENIVIRDGEPEHLSVRARPEMYLIT
jgi:Xaa-Pro dipeptidase